MLREHLVVGVRRQELRAGPGQLGAHEQGEHAGDEEERERVDQVEDPDLLVIGGREP